MKSLISILLAVALVIGLGSCVSPKERNGVDPLEVSATDLLVVGRVSFSPSIVYDTEVTSLDAFGKKTKSMVRATDPILTFASHSENSILNAGLGSAQTNPFVDYIRAGQTFIVKTEATELLYLRGFGLVIDDSFARDPAQTSKNTTVLAADYQMRFSAQVPRAARAIYIGHIIINRDENYLASSYTIENDFEAANAQFGIDFPSYKLIPVQLVDLEIKK